MEIKVQSRGRKVQLQIGKLNPITDRIVQLRIGNSNYRSENKFLLEIGLRNGRTTRRRRRRKQTIKTARAEARGQKSNMSAYKLSSVLTKSENIPKIR